MTPTPLIKGMFVNSHIKKLRSEKGEAAVAELQKRYGKPVVFKNFEDVPVREEVAILEHVLDLLNEDRVPQTERSYEAGRLHFRNFITTPFGKILVGTVPKTSSSFTKMLTNTGYIARHVFKNTNFGSEASTGNTIISIMNNNDYPLDHFRGFFYEWMQYWDLENPAVEASETEPLRYRYLLSWTA